MCGETASNVTNSRSEKENLPPVFISVKATAHDSHHSLVFCVESSALAASQHIHRLFVVSFHSAQTERWNELT